MICRECKTSSKREKLVKISLLAKGFKRREQLHCPHCGTRLIWNVVEGDAYAAS